MVAFDGYSISSARRIGRLEAKSFDIAIAIALMSSQYSRCLQSSRLVVCARGDETDKPKIVHQLTLAAIATPKQIVAQLSPAPAARISASDHPLGPLPRGREH
jgi:hypothetical protein